MSNEHSKALPRHCYQDPLALLIADEDKSCAGCKFAKVVFNRAYCGIDRKYGRRCSQFSEVENGRG